jgi:hypothetical protein
MASSLRSMIADGRFFFAVEAPTPEERPSLERNLTRLMTITRARLLAPETISVNAQAVWNDIAPSRSDRPEEVLMRALDYKQIPRPKPPFSSMWLEALVDGGPHHAVQRVGMLTTRGEVNGGLDLETLLRSPMGVEADPSIANLIRKDAPATVVHASVWHDLEGSASYDAELLYGLDQNGNFLSSGRSVLRALAEPGDDREKLRRHRALLVRVREGWMLHTFARLNCANVRLVPRQGGRYHHRRPRSHGAPPAVWHEIVVDAAPRLRAPAAEGENEVRLHWVRGHYADYSKGPGLFGNPQLRAMFWIPEHRAGREERGEVRASYRVAAGGPADGPRVEKVGENVRL